MVFKGRNITSSAVANTSSAPERSRYDEISGKRPLDVRRHATIAPSRSTGRVVLLHHCIRSGALLRLQCMRRSICQHLQLQKGETAMRIYDEDAYLQNTSIWVKSGTTGSTWTYTFNQFRQSNQFNLPPGMLAQLPQLPYRPNPYHYGDMSARAPLPPEDPKYTNLGMHWYIFSSRKVKLR